MGYFEIRNVRRVSGPCSRQFCLIQVLSYFCQFLANSSSMGKKTQSLSTILQRPIFTCQQYKALSQQDTQIFSTTDFLVNHPFYSLFHMKQHTVSDFRNSSKPKVGFGAFEIRYFARWKFRLHIFFTKSFFKNYYLTSNVLFINQIGKQL